MNQKEKDMTHFPSKRSENLEKYVIDDVLKSSRYIFIRRVARVQYGYCTHCNTRFKTSGDLKHNNTFECPNCQSHCKVKNHGTSRKYLSDHAFVVHYEKSKISPNSVIIAQAYNVHRNYSGDYTKVETEYVPLARYLFQSGNPGRAIMYEQWGGWRETQSVHSLWSHSYSTSRCSMDNIKDVVVGTPFEFSTWDQHEQPQPDYVKFFALYSKYPVIEILTKVGCKYFVSAKLFDGKTYSCINWRAKQLHEVLRLSKQNLRLILREKKLNPMQLRLFQLSRKDSAPPTLQEIKHFFTDSVGDVLNEMNKVLKYTTLRKAMNYMQKQLKSCKTYRTYSGLMIAWRDYIRDCETLQLDLTHSLVLFPKDLHEAHQKTMKLVEITIDEINKMKMAQRAETLKKYRYEDQVFIIRPAENAEELIEEGKNSNIVLLVMLITMLKAKLRFCLFVGKTNPIRPTTRLNYKKMKSNRLEVLKMPQ